MESRIAQRKTQGDLSNLFGGNFEFLILSAITNLGNAYIVEIIDWLKHATGLDYCPNHAIKVVSRFVQKGLLNKDATPLKSSPQGKPIRAAYSLTNNGVIVRKRYAQIMIPNLDISEKADLKDLRNGLSLIVLRAIDDLGSPTRAEIVTWISDHLKIRYAETGISTTLIRLAGKGLLINITSPATSKVFGRPGKAFCLTVKGKLALDHNIKILNSVTQDLTKASPPTNCT